MIRTTAVLVQVLVTFHGGQLVTDSRVLAKTFGRDPKNVLRSYDNLKCPDEDSRG